MSTVIRSANWSGRVLCNVKYGGASVWAGISISLPPVTLLSPLLVRVVGKIRYGSLVLPSAYC